MILLLPAAALGAAERADAPVAQRRLMPQELAQLAAAAGAGPAQTTLLVGDPAKPGLYSIRVRIPPHTDVPPHTHRDNRSVVVLSGTWSVGYGSHFDPSALKTLTAGSFYTEPAAQPHFSETGDEPVVISVTGYGPSDTAFVER